jgi:hypothetical protein
LNHIKKIHQPFTVIDVGWWYQVNLPKLPSGRIDYAAMETADGISGDGYACFNSLSRDLLSVSYFLTLPSLTGYAHICDLVFPH